MRKVIQIISSIFCIFSFLHADPIDLFDWAFNVNGTIYSKSGDNNILPSSFDDSRFDWSTGLGTLSINYNPGTVGDQLFLAFFDQEISEKSNTFFNEYGIVNGLPDDGNLLWEIDEPGYVYGDIYDNLINGAFDNTNSFLDGMRDDVSWGMGWNFNLEEGEYATIDLILSEEAPEEGFFLTMIDPDSGERIYFSTRIRIEGGVTPLPEPGTFSMVLMGTTFLGFYALRRRKKDKR